MLRGEISASVIAPRHILWRSNAALAPVAAGFTPASSFLSANESACGAWSQLSRRTPCTGRPKVGRYILIALLIASAPPAFAQNPPSSLAEEIVNQIAKLRASSKQKGQPKFRIAVIPFGPMEKEASRVGAEIAQKLSAEISVAAPDVELVDRAELDRELEREALWLSSLNEERTAWSLSAKLGLDLILTGSFKPREDGVELNVKEVSRWENGKIIRVKAMYAGGGDFLERLRQDQPLVLPGQADARGGAYRVGVGGIGQPSCLVCPNPKFTPEARAAKHQGVVVLRLIVTDEGRAASVRVISGLEYGLTQAAIEAVQGWKFKPATGSDGKPVPVWVTVEVIFRLLL